MAVYEVQMKNKEVKWKKCCAKFIISIYDTTPGILFGQFHCPKCGQYIGITGSSKKEQENFKKKYKK